jgi:O-antigen/teichoic acid export membrane protein
LGRRHNVRAHFWQTLANYLQSFGGLAMSVVLARMLPPKVFGEFALITATFFAVLLPISLSTGQLLLADRGKAAGLFERVLGLSWVICIIKLLIVFFIVFYFAFYLRDSTKAIVGALIGIPLAFSDLLATLRLDLESQGNFEPNFHVQTLQVFLNAFFSIGLVWLGLGIYGLAIGGFIAAIPSFVIYVSANSRKLNKFTLSSKGISSLLMPSLWLWLNQTCEGLFSRVDKIFLGARGGETELGYYNRAYNFAPISQLALNSLMANATVVGLARESSAKGRNRLFFKTSLIVFLGGFLNWAVWWWFSDPLVVWIFGNQWSGAIATFEAFSWLSLAYGLVYMPSTYLLARQHYRALGLCKFFGIIFLFLLLLAFFMDGEATSSSVAYAFLAALLAMGAVLGLMVFIFSRNDKDSN